MKIVATKNRLPERAAALLQAVQESLPSTMDGGAGHRGNTTLGVWGTLLLRLWLLELQLHGRVLMPSRVIRRDGAGNIITAPLPRRKTASELLAEKIYAGEIQRGLWRGSPWQAEERLVLIGGRPHWDIGEGELIPLTERDCKEVLRCAS